MSILRGRSGTYARPFPVFVDIVWFLFALFFKSGLSDAFSRFGDLETRQIERMPSKASPLFVTWIIHVPSCNKCQLKTRFDLQRENPVFLFFLFCRCPHTDIGATAIAIYSQVVIMPWSYRVGFFFFFWSERRSCYMHRVCFFKNVVKIFRIFMLQY